MANGTVRMWDIKSQSWIDVLYIDNGDGTYSLSVTDKDGGKVDIVLGASELHLGMVSGQGDSFHVEFTRPSDATPYAINDVVGPTGTAALLSLGNLARVNGGSIYIVKARLMTNQVGNVAAYRLHLYQDNTPTPIADNSPFALLWANRAVRVGYIDFDPMSTEGTGSDCAVSINKDIRMHIKCAAGARNLLGVLETKTIFTPASAQVYFIDLNAEQD